VATKAVYFFAVPGFADWEAAHALAELRRHGHYDVQVVGLNRRPIQSMGGVIVQPTCSLDEVDPRHVAVFILPGGDRWEEQPLERAVADILTTLDDHHVPLAAICAATTAIVRAGLIRGRRHTSNGLEYLKKQVPAIQTQRCMRTRQPFATAGSSPQSGLADVEFAQEIMAEPAVLNEEDRAYWTMLFRGGRLQVGL
jgi:transcriptional regulator GlxA family with amidase domain